MDLKRLTKEEINDQIERLVDLYQKNGARAEVKYQDPQITGSGRHNFHVTVVKIFDESKFSKFLIKNSLASEKGGKFHMKSNP